jgi:hypothetical protein
MSERLFERSFERPRFGAKRGAADQNASTEEQHLEPPFHRAGLQVSAAHAAGYLAEYVPALRSAQHACPNPNLRKTISKGQKFVNEDWIRLKPTKAVNQSQ